jgi:hypothetical protein
VDAPSRRGSAGCLSADRLKAALGADRFVREIEISAAPAARVVRLCAMVRVREARRAFRRFRTSCFWSYRPDLIIGPPDVPWVAEQLRKHGNREAWRVAAKLCR